MSDFPAAASLPPPPPGESWPRKKFVTLILLALALHTALIFILGTKKQVVPRAVTGVPHLQLVDSADELIALGDPTLFARPNAHDFVTAFWQRTPEFTAPDFNLKEPPRFLPPAPEKFGTAFRKYMRGARPAEFPLQYKPNPKLIVPAIALDDTLPPATTMQISGDLAGRRLLTTIALPSIAVNDVIAPTRVQALVDPEGNVASAVLLESSAFADADQRALRLTGNLRFAPAPRLMFGEIIFTWHTVPLTATNEPARTKMR